MGAQVGADGAIVSQTSHSFRRNRLHLTFAHIPSESPNPDVPLSYVDGYFSIGRQHLELAGVIGVAKRNQHPVTDNQRYASKGTQAVAADRVSRLGIGHNDSTLRSRMIDRQNSRRAEVDIHTHRGSFDMIYRAKVGGGTGGVRSDQRHKAHKGQSPNRQNSSFDRNLKCRRLSLKRAPFGLRQMAAVSSDCRG